MSSPLKSLGVVFAAAFLVSVLVLFALVRYCETNTRCDSIGTWYTVYSAVALAAIVAGAVMAVVAISRALRSHQAKQARRATDA